MTPISTVEIVDIEYDHIRLPLPRLWATEMIRATILSVPPTIQHSQFLKDRGQPCSATVLAYFPRFLPSATNRTAVTATEAHS